MEENKNELAPKGEESLNTTTNNIVDKIIESDDVEATKELLKLFNLNMAKKSAVRVAKLNDLLDKVNDTAIDRLESRPDIITNKELLDYMKEVQSQIEKSNNTIKSVEDAPAISLNKQEVNININDSSANLSKESRERIMSVVNAILNKAKEEDNVVDAQVVRKEDTEGEINE